MKFINYQNLLNPGDATTDGVNPWTNPPSLDAEAIADIGENGELIRH